MIQSKDKYKFNSTKYGIDMAKVYQTLKILIKPVGNLRLQNQPTKIIFEGNFALYLKVNDFQNEFNIEIDFYHCHTIRHSCLFECSSINFCNNPPYYLADHVWV